MRVINIQRIPKATVAFVTLGSAIILAVAGVRYIDVTADTPTITAARPGEVETNLIEERRDSSQVRDQLTTEGKQCPGNPSALGTGRTIVVDPHEHNRIGTMSYAETLPLLDNEVVLTFDDGPAHPYTDKILDILASECVRATFFIVGRMAKVHPELIRRAYNEGHTIGTHTMNHPRHFQSLTAERAKQEIDNGIETVTTALGDPSKLAPFFRFPGFAHSEAVEEYLASRELMVWSADFPADDWRKLRAEQVARLALSRLENKRKGILLLHDIHERTVEALPAILAELKARGFHIVHVVPARPDRPKTATMADEWLPKWRPNHFTER